MYKFFACRFDLLVSGVSVGVLWCLMVSSFGALFLVVFGCVSLYLRDNLYN